MHKIGQSGQFLGKLLRTFLKAGSSLMKKVLKQLAKSLLTPLRVTPAASATDGPPIHQKMFGSGNTTLTVFNEEMNDIMKIVKSLKDSCLMIKGVSETIKDKVKEQNWGFLSMLLGNLGVSLLGNLLTGKGVNMPKILGQGVIRADKLLMSLHPWTNFKIQKYYQNEPEFKGVYSKINLLKIKDGAYIINLDEYESIETHQIAQYVDGNNAICFGSFGVEHYCKWK